jgi:hypothetical protein
LPCSSIAVITAELAARVAAYGQFIAGHRYIV